MWIRTYGLAVALLASLPVAAQVPSPPWNAGWIQGKRIQNPLSVSSGCAVAWNISTLQFECTSVSGSAVWGSITGTLSSQTDLNTALGLKAPLISPSFTTPTLGVATATSLNKVTVTAPASAATLTLANNSTLVTSGAFSTTLTSSATTVSTLPAGTHSLAPLDSPTFTTPTLGVAAGTSLALGGATIGSNALAVTGASNLSSTLIVNSTLSVNMATVPVGSIKAQFHLGTDANLGFINDLGVATFDSFSDDGNAFEPMQLKATTIAVNALTGIGPGNTTSLTSTLNVTDKTATTGATRVVFGLGAADSASTATVVNAGTTKSAGYQSSDGSAGVTVTTCTGFKNGLCISGT